MTTALKDNAHVRSFFSHLDELRARFVRCLIAFVLSLFISYPFSDKILQWMIEPVSPLYFTAPADAFLAQMIVTFVGGLFLSLTYILYEVWQFIGLALKAQERRVLFYFLPLSVGLFALGVVFAYTVIIPFMFKFFLSFSSGYLTPMITVKNYIAFVGRMIICFGVVFQLPLVLVFLAKIGIATPEFLIQKRRHAFILILIMSAIITPADVVSMILMTIPLIALYEVGILMVKVQYASQKKNENKV